MVDGYVCSCVGSDPYSPDRYVLPRIQGGVAVVFGHKEGDTVRIVASNTIWPRMEEFIGKEATVLETKDTLTEGKACLIAVMNNDGWTSRMWWNASSLEVIDSE